MNVDPGDVYDSMGDCLIGTLFKQVDLDPPMHDPVSPRPPSPNLFYRDSRYFFDAPTKPKDLMCSCQIKCEKGVAAVRCYSCQTFDPKGEGLYCVECFRSRHPWYRAEHKFVALVDDEVPERVIEEEMYRADVDRIVYDIADLLRRTAAAANEVQLQHKDMETEDTVRASARHLVNLDARLRHLIDYVRVSNDYSTRSKLVPVFRELDEQRQRLAEIEGEASMSVRHEFGKELEETSAYGKHLQATRRPSLFSDSLRVSSSFSDNDVIPAMATERGKLRRRHSVGAAKPSPRQLKDLRRQESDSDVKHSARSTESEPLMVRRDSSTRAGGSRRGSENLLLRRSGSDKGIAGDSALTADHSGRARNLSVGFGSPGTPGTPPDTDRTGDGASLDRPPRRERSKSVSFAAGPGAAPSSARLSSAGGAMLGDPLGMPLRPALRDSRRTGAGRAESGNGGGGNG